MNQNEDTSEYSKVQKENEEAQDNLTEEPSKNKEPKWKKYQKMPLEEKRKHYECREDYVQIEDIKKWSEFYQSDGYHFSKIQKKNESEKTGYPVDENINDKLSLWVGDITTLEIDAIVNAANSRLCGGGGVDGCIHRAAGPTLLKECRLLNGCDTGDAKITSGHKLPARHVIHTVGPIGKDEKALENCYKNCLRLAKENEVRTLAFCCVSTGIFGYPNRDAAEVALKTTREWLGDESNANAVDRIIFCLFLEKDINIYETLMLKYFPPGELKKPTETSEEIPNAHTNSEKDKKTGINEPEKEEKKDAKTEIKDKDDTKNSDEKSEKEPEKKEKKDAITEIKDKDDTKSNSDEKSEKEPKKEKKDAITEIKDKDNTKNSDEKSEKEPEKKEKKDAKTEIKDKEMKKVEMQRGRKIKDQEKGYVEIPIPKKPKHYKNVDETKGQQDVEMNDEETQAKQQQNTEENKREKKMQDVKIPIPKNQKQDNNDHGEMKGQQDVEMNEERTQANQDAEENKQHEKMQKQDDKMEVEEDNLSKQETGEKEVMGIKEQQANETMETVEMQHEEV